MARTAENGIVPRKVDASIVNGKVITIGPKICLLQEDGQSCQAYDDVTGLPFDATKVYEASLTEVAHIREQRVRTKIRRSAAKAKA